MRTFAVALVALLTGCRTAAAYRVELESPVHYETTHPRPERYAAGPPVEGTSCAEGQTDTLPHELERNLDQGSGLVDVWLYPGWFITDTFRVDAQDRAFSKRPMYSTRVRCWEIYARPVIPAAPGG